LKNDLAENHFTGRPAPRHRLESNHRIRVRDDAGNGTENGIVARAKRRGIDGALVVRLRETSGGFSSISFTELDFNVYSIDIPKVQP
jgi:hypothetical protein